MFITRLLYWHFFLSHVFEEFCLVIVGHKFDWRELALVFVTQITNNAFCQLRQTLFALVSGLASSPVKPLMFSPFMGSKRGSASTSRISFNITVYLPYQVSFKIPDVAISNYNRSSSFTI